MTILRVTSVLLGDVGREHHRITAYGGVMVMRPGDDTNGPPEEIISGRCSYLFDTGAATSST